MGPGLKSMRTSQFRVFFPFDLSTFVSSLLLDIAVRSPWPVPEIFEAQQRLYPLNLVWSARGLRHPALFNGRGDDCAS